MQWTINAETQRGGFFLSPRRRSGERIEERGQPRPTRLLSPALSSIRWRRGGNPAA
jgi:hypothetical protein